MGPASGRPDDRLRDALRRMAASQCRVSILRDARLRHAPQDEAESWPYDWRALRLARKPVDCGYIRGYIINDGIRVVGSETSRRPARSRD